MPILNLSNKPLCSLMNNSRDTKLLKAFGKKLKALRKQKGLSQMKLSYAAEIELHFILRKVYFQLFRKTVPRIVSHRGHCGLEQKSYFA